MSETHRPGWAKPLDESLYAPDDEEKAFMKTTTGIQDDDELKRHIIAVQTKAFGVSMQLHRMQEAGSHSSLFYQLYKYPCIRMFEFMRSASS